MFQFRSLLLVTLLISVALTAPAPARHLRKRSFKIPRVQQHNYVPDGTFALRKAYRKFGIGTLDTYPGTRFAPNLAVVNNKNGGNETEDGEVSASPIQNDAEFLSPVSVGGQTLVMNFDSGSSDM